MKPTRRTVFNTIYFTAAALCFGVLTALTATRCITFGIIPGMLAVLYSALAGLSIAELCGKGLDFTDTAGVIGKCQGKAWRFAGIFVPLPLVFIAFVFAVDVLELPTLWSSNWEAKRIARFSTFAMGAPRAYQFLDQLRQYHVSRNDKARADAIEKREEKLRKIMIKHRGHNCAWTR